MEYENFTFVEALKFLADRAGVELPQMEYSKEAKEQADLKNTLLEINKQAAKFYYYQLHTERGKQGYDYLKGRGLSDDTIRKFGLGYSDKYGSLLYRFLKEKGYDDEILRQSGLFWRTRCMACRTSSGTVSFTRSWMPTAVSSASEAV